MTIAMHASSSVTGSFSRDQRAHRLLHAQRLAEVAVQHAAQPVEIANRKRLVEVQRFAQVRDHRRVALLAGEHHRRIAGQQLLQPEDQDRDEDSVGTIVAIRRTINVSSRWHRRRKRFRCLRRSPRVAGTITLRHRRLSEPQSGHANEPVGNRAQAVELARVRPQPVPVVEVDDRPVLQHDRREFGVELACARSCRASCATA